MSDLDVFYPRLHKDRLRVSISYPATMRAPLSLSNVQKVTDLAKELSIAFIPSGTDDYLQQMADNSSEKSIYPNAYVQNSIETAD